MSESTCMHDKIHIKVSIGKWKESGNNHIIAFPWIENKLELNSDQDEENFN